MAVAEFEVTVPAPKTAEAVAVLITDPSSKSDCVMVRVPVQDFVAKGPIVPAGFVQVMPLALPSVIPNAGERVTFPVLVRVYVYVTRVPSVVAEVGLADTDKDRAGDCVMLTLVVTVFEVWV